MPDIHAILFDLGNTLLYFNGEWPGVLSAARRAALQALHQAGLQVEMASFLDIFRQTLENHYARREDDLLERTTQELLAEVLTTMGYPSLPDPLLDAARRGFYRVTQAYWQPETDALPTLQALSQRYRLGIISNASDDWDVQTLVDKAELRPYLDFVITSAAFGQRKPAPAIFHAALTRWNLSPPQVAMVGDTLSADILGANRAGLFSIWITRRVLDLHAIALEGDYRPNLTVTSLHSLPPELEKNWSHP